MARNFTPTRLLVLTSLLSTLLFLEAQAAPVSMDQVRVMTGNWLAGKTDALGANRQVRELRPLSWDAATPVFYLASLDGKGWILTSGDDALVPVIGYSDKALPAGDLPPAMIDWLKAEEQEVLKLRARDASSAPAIEAWSRLIAGGQESDAPIRTEVGDDVAPMIEAHWGQGSSYNAFCPSDAAGPGGHAYVGCVGVALAQVMDYWNWPQQGQYLQSYEHAIYGILTVDFNTVTYDWTAITPNATAPAVRELLYHAGVAVRMNYGPGTSTASTSMIVSSLRTFFRYQDSARMVWRSSYTPEAWQTLLQTELAAGRPMIYRGQGPNGGHAFNMDGVQDQSWFHINWGWGGSYDGWFQVTDMSPGNYSFDSVQGAVIGIAPLGVPVNHAPLVPSLVLECLEDDTLSVELVGYDEDDDTLSFQVNGESLSGSTWTWTAGANMHGTYHFQYQACDGGGCSQTAEITVNVLPVNDTPVARPVSARSNHAGDQAIQLVAWDIDGDQLTYFVDGLAIDGSIFHTSVANMNNDLAFSYWVSDGQAVSDTVGVTLTFTAKPQIDKQPMFAIINRAGGAGDGTCAEEPLPGATKLTPAHPNPFNPTTTLEFDLAESGAARLTIYNMLGQEVKVLVNDMLGAGSHRVAWNATGSASGVYLAVLQTPTGIEKQILQLVK